MTHRTAISISMTLGHSSAESSQSYSGGLVHWLSHSLNVEHLTMCQFQICGLTWLGFEPMNLPGSHQATQWVHNTKRTKLCVHKIVCFCRKSRSCFIRSFSTHRGNLCFEQECIIILCVLTLTAVSPHFSMAAKPCVYMCCSNRVINSPKPFGILDTRLYILAKSVERK